MGGRDSPKDPLEQPRNPHAHARDVVVSSTVVRLSSCGDQKRPRTHTSGSWSEVEVPCQPISRHENGVRQSKKLAVPSAVLVMQGL